MTPEELICRCKHLEQENERLKAVNKYLERECLRLIEQTATSNPRHDDNDSD